MKYNSRDTTGLESYGDGAGSQKGGGDVPPSIQLDIMGHKGESSWISGCSGGLRTGGPGSATFFEPWRELTPGSGSGHGRSERGGGRHREPPEKRLTLLALRLAVLEKVASGLGKLDFVWATVVLLGGFASTLTITDFWCVTVILVGEGARVFIRSHELDVSELLLPYIVAFMRQRAWQVTGWVFVSRKIGRLLNWLQVLSALACVALSVMRLWKHDLAGRDSRNTRPALLLFYTLALVEASLFLVEKAYWTWKVSVCKLLDQVSAECELGAYGLVSLTRFYYDAYSRCIAGSIFDGIKMDLVTFAEDLILSGFLDEQLIGVRILQQLANSERSASDTLHKVGTTPRSIERLVEMLNWKRPQEEEVRRCAAEIVSKIAGKRTQSSLRVSGIPGSIESITSLLDTGRSPPVSGMHPQLPGGASPPASCGYDHLPFNLLGLLILKRLARDHDNCGMIGNARGLLAKVIGFTQASPALRNPHVTDSHVCAVKRALKVVKMLVCTAGNTGKALREGVAENVFALTNLRDILQHGQRHRELQKLATDVLTGLAMDDNGKEAIVATGGVVKLLLSIFFNAQDTELGCEAGEALAMLALESEAGCAAILKRADALDQLVSALQGGDARRRLNAARVLRNLCAYSGQQQRERLRVVVTRALPAVLNATMVGRDKILEVSVGLTTEICMFIDGEQFAAELRGAGVADEWAYVERLASVLRRYGYPEIRVPHMRRFVVQQVIWLMSNSRGRGDDDDGGYVELLREVGMEGLLESIADTTSELECYHVFSGSVGISKHRESFSAIVDSALELIAGSGDGDRAED